MTTITLLLAILAILTSVFTLVMNMATNREIGKELADLQEGVRECANRTTLNKLDIATIDNRTQPKPKVRRGRPRKDGK